MDGRIADSGFAAAVVMETHQAWRQLLQGETKCSFDKEPCWQGAVQPAAQREQALLRKTVMLKLNGGLGTSMGLDEPKSLLPIADQQNTFLDLIAEQVQTVRRAHGSHALKFMLMNSFATSDSTHAYLKQHHPGFEWSELMQNEVPKVDASTLQPVQWGADSELEWCPPGHGDLYVALAASGQLEQLLTSGYEYLFVSNADNLGAVLDTELLSKFAGSESSFQMEVCERTASDKKGGHLAVNASTGGLLLREVAQCEEEDQNQFQDYHKYQYFNTNNLWIKLKPLKELLDSDQLQLPVMINHKTVDPKDKSSSAVLQLELAMGAAISLFESASAIVVPRSRFTPVKKTNDLFVLRSDAYQRSGVHHTMQLSPGVLRPPSVVLDDSMKLISQFEAAVARGVPSMKGCSDLAVQGPVLFGAGVVFEGKVTVRNPSAHSVLLPAGLYKDQVVDLSPETAKEEL
eukprot:TRINITY_DN16706_c0_g1_i8.p1 TRINITY_DN16706_c0_g1~~TRINITY_DN16706_c0_g1_i8.p1  ORF type:complete len:460 (-),score=178.14 TRINITY_DN16706_c0_g1_i8:296-1675(-)